jgi:hypothetical protein
LEKQLHFLSPEFTHRGAGGFRHTHHHLTLEVGNLIRILFNFCHVNEELKESQTELNFVINGENIIIRNQTVVIKAILDVRQVALSKTGTTLSQNNW